MAKEMPRVGDLPRKSDVSGNETEAAAAAYLRDENAKPFAFKSEHTIDVAEAIEIHPQAKKLLADKATTPCLRRTLVIPPSSGASRSRDERRSGSRTRAHRDPVHDAAAGRGSRGGSA